MAYLAAVARAGPGADWAGWGGEGRPLATFAYISMHPERGHVLDGNRGKTNYTDSVRGLMIDAHNTDQQPPGLQAAWARPRPAGEPARSRDYQAHA